MSDQLSVSRDAQYLKLDNELRDLKQQRQKARPALYLLLAIILGLLGFFVPIPIAIFVWLFALASLLAAITAVAKVNSLNGQIAKVEARMKSIASAAPSAPAPTTASVTDKIVQLQGLLDKKLITQEEFDAKKAELLKQI